MSKTVSLVLGSGGARGYAHIGAIDALIERNYDIIAISGCSMGALVGGLYCAGKLDDYRDWVTGLSYVDVLRLLDMSFVSKGAIKGDKVFAVINELIGNALIEELPIPYTAVSTDLVNQKEVWFQSGDLQLAMRASLSIPSLFTPVIHGNRVLVDGGVLNPLPIAPSVSAHADIVVAVDVSSSMVRDNFIDTKNAINESSLLIDDEEARLDYDDDLFDPKLSEWMKGVEQTLSTDTPMKRFDNWVEEIKHKAVQLFDRSEVSQSAQSDMSNLGLLGIVNQTLETMQSSLVRYQIASYPPDVLIEIPKTGCRVYDFHKAASQIQLGYETTSKILDRYESKASLVRRPWI